MNQLICHLIGDYIIQNDWMAINKTKNIGVALIHAITYSLPFLFLGPSISALFVVVGTHAFIDRFRLARYIIWFRNKFAPNSSWSDWPECSFTGFPADRPVWLTTWLLIITDNIIHIIINGLALKYL